MSEHNYRYFEPKYSNFRTNGFTGVVEYMQGASDIKMVVHANEWWNGEGLDLTGFRVEDNEEEFHVSLHSCDILHIATLAVCSGHLEIDELKHMVELMQTAHTNYQKEIDAIKESAGTVPTSS